MMQLNSETKSEQLKVEQNFQFFFGGWSSHKLLWPMGPIFISNEFFTSEISSWPDLLFETLEGKEDYFQKKKEFKILVSKLVLIVIPLSFLIKEEIFFSR